jgi:UDP-glucose 4-epimerase
VRVLVTGGSGFIGKYLVKSLIEKGNVVTIFDNFSNSSKKSILNLIDIGAKAIEGDITKLHEISDAVKNQEIVIHLAAKISVQESIRNPLETFQVNVDGTKNVLVACEKNRVKKLIVASSAAVYGEGSPDVKLIEESETNPISPYGESKLKMEQEIREFASKHDIDCVILRFFNIYGIGQSDEYAGVISKFANCIQQDIPLIIYGNGKQTRDFVAIEDIVNLICRILTLKLEKRFDVYNIGNEKSTIFDLANLMIQSSGKNIKIIFKERKQGEIIHSMASSGKAKENLGYNPEILLKEGIEKFLFHQNNI